MSDSFYVVIEYNQASYQPSLADDQLHQCLVDAQYEMKYHQEKTRALGRCETYRLAEVQILEDRGRADDHASA